MGTLRLQGMLALAVAPLVVSGAPVGAQTEVLACESQQSLEQYTRSGGNIVPDDCRAVSVTPLQSDTGQLCLIEFGEGGSGILDELRDLATSSAWWVLCADLDVERTTLPQ